MNYYKILNEKEKHHKMQYKTGLNIDLLPFNPSGNCQPGGIYFAEKDILGFLNYGPWIRKVTLPEDAQVYENPGLPKKWKSNKVILGRKYKITAKIIQKLLDEGVDPNINVSYPLRWAANNGHLEIAKVLIGGGADPKAVNSEPLQLAAKNGNLQMTKLLIPISDPNTGDMYALRLAAANDHFDVVKELIPVSNISKFAKYWIKNSCENQEIKDLILSYKKES